MSARTRWRAGLALCLLMPIIEIVVAVQVAHLIGALWTVLALLVLSTLGMMLVRLQGAHAFADLRAAAREQRQPGRSLADRVLLLIGGVLLSVPGFVTAVVSLPFLLPFTRPLLRGAVAGWAVRRGSMYVSTQTGTPPGADASRHGPSSPFGADVVRGEVIDDS